MKNIKDLISISNPQMTQIFHDLLPTLFQSDTVKLFVNFLCVSSVQIVRIGRYTNYNLTDFIVACKKRY